MHSVRRPPGFCGCHRFLDQSFGHSTARSLLDWIRIVVRGRGGLCQCDSARRSLVSLHVDRPRWPGLVQLRLGSAAARNRISRDLSLSAAPIRDVHEPAAARHIFWLFRLLIFKIMLGSGLIKIRGDESWRDLTALSYHFETQPIPNGLSRWFHFLPRGVLKFGTLFNHLAELVAPWFVFWPRIARYAAGIIIIAFPNRD